MRRALQRKQSSGMAPLPDTSPKRRQGSSATNWRIRSQHKLPALKMLLRRGSTHWLMAIPGLAFFSTGLLRRRCRAQRTHQTVRCPQLGHNCHRGAGLQGHRRPRQEDSAGRQGAHLRYLTFTLLTGARRALKRPPETSAKRPLVGKPTSSACALKRRAQPG